MNILERATMGGDSTSTGVEVSLQKRLVIIGSLLVIPATLIWGLVYLAFQETDAGIISLVYGVATSFALPLIGVTHRFRIYLFFQLILGLTLPFLHTMILGGIINSGGVILWSMIGPIGALVFYKPRQGFYWWTVFILLIVISGVSQPYLRQNNNLPQSIITIFMVLNIMVVSSIGFIVLNYFISQKNNILKLLQQEQEKAEGLLLNILPKEIADILKNENRVIADQYEGASILFSDLVGFTNLTAKLSPVEMVNLLNEVFSYFDSLVEKYSLEKIRTVGDNYMVASGVPKKRPDHAEIIARLALDMRQYIDHRPALDGTRIEFRMGINSGPVIGGVNGRKKFVYDLWGDAVNIASRMESQGVPGKIQITRTTYELIKDNFICEPRGLILVKGRGEMETWYLIGQK